MSRIHRWLLPHAHNNQRAKLLHPSGLLAVLILFLWVQFLLTRTAAVFPNILGYASQIPPEEIIRLTNQVRQSKGLEPLRADSSLSSAAAQKASDMLARDYWAHTSPVGTEPWYFITESGYTYRYAGENLARDFSNPQAVVDAWMASPSHRDNLLSARYQDIGVAVVDGRLTGSETTLVVQMFGSKISAAPRVSTASQVIPKVAALPTAVPVIQPSATPALTPTALPLLAATSPVPPPSDEPVASATTLVSPFTVNKVFSLSLLSLIVAVLVADIIVVNRRQIVRWTSKSFAHFVFLGLLLMAAASIAAGQIL